MTAKSGASLACSTWPLCNGELVPDLTDGGIRIHFMHRVLAAVDRSRLAGSCSGAAGVAGVARRCAASRRSPPALVLVQVGLGGLVILLEVPVWQAVLHQAVGVLDLRHDHAAALALRAAAPRRTVLGDPDGLALRGA